MERDIFRRCVKRVRNFLSPYWRGGRKGLRKFVRGMLAPFRENPNILAELIRTPAKVVAMAGLALALNAEPDLKSITDPSTSMARSQAVVNGSPARVVSGEGNHFAERRHAVPTDLSAGSRKEIVFIDRALPHPDELAQAARAGLQVYFIEPTQSGIRQITDTLNAQTDVQAIHILSGGGTGYVLLGSDAVTADTLGYFKTDLRSWSKALTERADILFYGCFSASTPDGEALFRGIAGYTGADVAGSVDLTGGEKRGGNWELEKQVGEIDTAGLAIPTWDGHMATFTVLNLGDAGAGSLRQAVADAKGAPGPDTIDFYGGLKGTIGLKSTITIDDDVTISGPGAKTISIQPYYGYSTGTLFSVLGGTVEISGLEFSKGDGAKAGAIINSSDALTIRDCRFSNNKGTDAYSGGAINNDGGQIGISGTDFLYNTSKGGYGGGAISNNEGTVNIGGYSYFTKNSGYGGGIANDGGQVSVSDSHIYYNYGYNYGAGGITSYNGELQIESSGIYSNRGYAGGAKINGGSATITGSDLVNNGFGGRVQVGGVLNTYGQLDLTGTRVAYNYGRTVGGIANGLAALYFGPPINKDASVQDIARKGGQVTLNKSLVLENYSYGTAGILNYFGALTIDYSYIIGNGDDGPTPGIGGILNLNTYAGPRKPPLPGSQRAASRATGDYGNVTIRDSQINYNNGSKIGGVANIAGELTASYCEFAHNDGYVGAIANVATLGSPVIDAAGARALAGYGTANISNSTIEWNDGYVAGIDNYGGQLTISESELRYNYGTRAGAIRNETAYAYQPEPESADARGAGPLAGFVYLASTDIDDSVITYNEGSHSFDGAGAIFNEGGSVFIDDSTVAYNRSRGFLLSGGAIVNTAAFFRPVGAAQARAASDYGNVSITNSTLSGNQAYNSGSGGAIHTESGYLDVTNSTVSGNTASSDGGGLYASGTEVKVSNSTFADNEAGYDTTGYGGGIYFSTVGGSLTLSSSVLAYNTDSGLVPTLPASAAPDLADFPGKAVATNSLIEDPNGHSFVNGPYGNIVGVPAGLDYLGYNGGPTMTHALLKGSPAIDTGENLLGLPTDQRGGLRTINGVTDMGAFEYGNNPPSGTNVEQYHTYPPGTASVDLDDIVVSDIDPDEEITATLTVNDTSAGGLSTASGNGETYDSNTGVWTVTGSLDAVNAALAALAFLPDAGNPVDTTIAVDIRDGMEDGAAAVTGTITMDVDNGPPIINSVDATPNPTHVGNVVMFAVDAEDPDNDPLTYAWDFGDGNTGTGATPTHAYGAIGTYTVKVTVSDGEFEVSETVSVVVEEGAPIAGVGPDSDGDGFSDSLEEFTGTDPNDPSSTPWEIGPITEAPLNFVRKISVFLKFRSIGKDRIRLIADLPVPDGFVWEGQQVIVDIGGVQKKFVLDRRRRAKDGDVRVTFGRPRLGFSRMTLARRFMGDYQNTLAASSGLNNADVKEENRIIRVTILWNNRPLVVNESVPYNAKKDSRGIAKKTNQQR